ncbi:hypothetical protein BDW62DRAFT_189404 [Aspergillus aurantiobrunneus]
MVDFLSDCRTIQHPKLQELDRLGPCVDLSLYKDDSGVYQQVLFNFNLLYKPLRPQMAWDELHILKSLSTHPNIVPLVALFSQTSKLGQSDSQHIFQVEPLASQAFYLGLSGCNSLSSSWISLTWKLGIVHQGIALEIR